MVKRILITRLWPRPVIAQLERDFEVAFDPTDQPLSQEFLHQAMTEFDIICPTITDRIDAQIMAASDRRVRLIANFGAGCDHIDLDAARAADIVVTNTPDVLTQSTAELAILLMLSAARRAGEGERQLRARHWPGWHPMHLLGRSLQGRELGLIGFGRIAQAVARMASDLLDMRISYHSRRPVNPGPDVPKAAYCPSLETLLERSDVISLHCPGGQETHHLIDSAAFAKMQAHALLINTARGSVVDEQALETALKEGRLAGAGLDVFENEPKVHPGLLELENVVLLPHLGSATVETRIAMGMRVVANIDAFLEGREPPDRVA